jgi:hypothetical protein
VPPSGSYGVRNRAKLRLGCNIVGLGLAGIQTAGLVEVDEGIRPPYVDAELFPAYNPFWTLQKEFEDFRLLFLQLDVGALLTSANCLLSAAGKESLDQNDIGIAIADCSE